MGSDRPAQALGVFQRAVELPREEQERFAIHACGDDAELLERVLAMLRADSDAEPLLDATPNELATAFASGPPPTLEGRRIGPYTITALLGRGGMGVVYLARRDDVQKLVALKLVAGGSASPDRVARFFQERRVLAQLEHPNIARFVDAGVTEDGTPWFAMDYVPGQPIDVYCDKHNLSIDDRLALFERVCAAVAYAHRHLVVHRDLKPSNILVTTDGEPRLVDFGIAKLLAESDDIVSLTASHSLPMTPQYASPEQIRGEPITTASDVYQLGALLFELLTGRAPHPERLGRLAARGDVAVVKPSSVVERPIASAGPATTTRSAEDLAGARRTSPDRLRRRLSGDLDTVVAKATQLESPRRYATTQQLADDVRRHMDGLPPLARPTSATYRLGRFVRRHKAGTGVVVAAASTLVVFALAMAEQARRVEAQRRQAEEVSTLLTDLFAGADPTVTQGDTVSIATLLDRGAERVRAGLTNDPEVRARLLTVIGRAYRNLGQNARSAQVQSEAVDALRSVLPPDHPLLLTSVSRLSGELLATGDLAGATSVITEAVDVARSLRPSRRFELAVVLSADAFVRQHANDPSGAIRRYNEAIDIYRSLPDTLGIWLEEALVNLGYVEKDRGNLARADELLREAVERRRKRLGAEHSLTAKTLLDLAGVLVARNQLDSAEQFVREAVAVQQRVFIRPNAEVVGGLGTMAQILAARGNYAAAEGTQRNALSTARQVYGDSAAAVTMAVANLAGYVQRQGRLEEADVLHRDALQRYAAQVGERHPSTAIVMTNVAYTAYLRRRFDEAEAMYRKAIPVLDSAWQGGPRIAQALADFATVLRERGQCAEGEAQSRRAWTLLRGESPQRYLYPQRVLGTCLVRLRRFAEAESLLVDAYTRLSQSLGPAHIYTRGTVQDIVQLYDAWGKPDSARRYRDVLKRSP